MKFIESLKEGMHISEVYLCKTKTIAVSKTGKEYASLSLQDKTGSIDAKIWDLYSPGISDVDAMTFVVVDAEVTSFNNTLQLKVARIREADAKEYTASDYVPVSKKDIEKMFVELKEKIALLRREIPDICLRTTLITGFPGETEEDFQDVLSFISEERFDRLGVFPYSQEEGTPAASMENQIPESVKNKRLSRIMELQQEIAFQKAEEQRGRILKALITGYDEEEGRVILRSYMDSPEIDSFIFVKGPERVSGEFVQVKVVDTEGYDLIGEYCESSQ